MSLFSNRSQKTPKYAKTNSAIALLATLLFVPHVLTPSVIYYYYFSRSVLQRLCNKSSISKFLHLSVAFLLAYLSTGSWTDTVPEIIYDIRKLLPKSNQLEDVWHFSETFKKKTAHPGLQQKQNVFLFHAKCNHFAIRDQCWPINHRRSWLFLKRALILFSTWQFVNVIS